MLEENEIFVEGLSMCQEQLPSERLIRHMENSSIDAFKNTKQQVKYTSPIIMQRTAMGYNQPQQSIESCTSEISYHKTQEPAHSIVLSKLLDEKTIHQIDIDIKRLEPELKIIDGIDVTPMYYHILGLIAYKRPSLGYTQGMADILAPFITTYTLENIETAESSAYLCFSMLLNEIQSNIIDLQYPLISMLDEALRLSDLNLHAYLKKIGLETHMFAFRWFNCLFIREFKLSSLLKVLDTIFSADNTINYLIYLGVGLLLKFKSVLLENDFSSNILFLQNLHEREWEEGEIEMLLASVNMYRKSLDPHFNPCG